MEKNLNRYCKRAIALGAESAKIIPAAEVVTAEWVRLKCQFGCSVYGTRLTCPPFSPTPEYTRNMLEHYSHGLLIIHRVESREDEDEKLDKLKRTVASLEREIFLDGYYNALGMGAGPCYFCNTCDVNQSCKYPEIARPAMEACGIDVFTTVRKAGFEIEVVTSYDQPCTYCGLVLFGTKDISSKENHA